MGAETIRVTPKPRRFWAMWTYIANYGGPHEVLAVDAKAAADCVYGIYSEDFRKKAKVYVFDSPPISFSS